MIVLHLSDIVWAFCAFVGVLLLTHSPGWALGVGLLIAWAAWDLRNGH